MVGRGSTRFNMVTRCSPRLSSAKGNHAENLGGSPSEKSRAYWNLELEKSLVALLHEHNNAHYRGPNGWSTQAWNKIVKEFRDRNKYVSFTKAQIQEKEREMKRDYKMLKEARRQNGCRWNEHKCMIEAGPDIWDNILAAFPKAKKFRNNKASFPLFDALGELYDGRLPEGTYNLTSIRSPQDTSLRQIDIINELDRIELIIPRLGEEAYDVEDADAPEQRNEDEDAFVARNGKQRRAATASRDQEDEDASFARNGQQRRATSASTSAEESAKKSRASWNPELEKSLVELLHEHNNANYRSIYGWSSQAWNNIVKEFHDRNKYVSFTKVQIQEKENQLKKDYKMLKEARRQSGCRWNEQRCMIEAGPELWDNIIATFPKAKKFRNNKASFPLFDALGELYDGHLAEGTRSFTSTRSPREPSLRQLDNINELDNSEFIIPDSGEGLPYDVEDADARNEDEDANVARNGKQRTVATASRGQEDEDACFTRNGQRRRTTVSTRAEKVGGSPSEKSRASWNPELEKSLVELLHEHNNTHYRGPNGWSSEAWNKIVKEFHDRNKYVSFTKAQIQEKESQMKRDYKMLKEARRQSGCRWNEQRCMIEAEPDLWDNIIATFPKAKKFRNNKASFPLFDALGELYDGHLAKGTYSSTSIRSTQDPSLRQIDNRNELGNTEFIISDLGEDLGHDVEDVDAQQQRNEGEDTIVARNGKQRRAASESRDQEDEDASVARNGQQRRATTASRDHVYEDVSNGQQRRVDVVSRNIEEREPKRPKNSANIEEMMKRYLNTRTKQAEDEDALLVKIKEAVKGVDISIKRCISVLNSMEVTKEEKAKAYSVFKNQDNREIFLSACDEDPESALIWLRNEMA